MEEGCITALLLCLVNFAKYLATEASLPSLLIGHKTLGSGKDRDTVVIEDTRQVILVDIDTETRFANSFDTGNRRFAGLLVAQAYLQLIKISLSAPLSELLDTDILYPAFLLQDLSELMLNLAHRQDNFRLLYG